MLKLKLLQKYLKIFLLAANILVLGGLVYVQIGFQDRLARLESTSERHLQLIRAESIRAEYETQKNNTRALIRACLFESGHTGPVTVFSLNFVEDEWKGPEVCKEYVDALDQQIAWSVSARKLIEELDYSRVWAEIELASRINRDAEESWNETDD